MKPIFFLIVLFFISVGYPAYSYSNILVCGNSTTCGPAYTPPSGGGDGPFYGNVTNATNETIVPASPITGFSIGVLAFLNDGADLLASFIITENGPERIVVGRVVFFLFLVAIILMCFGVFFLYKKAKKHIKK